MKTDMRNYFGGKNTYIKSMLLSGMIDVDKWHEALDKSEFENTDLVITINGTEVGHDKLENQIERWVSRIIDPYVTEFESKVRQVMFDTMSDPFKEALNNMQDKFNSVSEKLNDIHYDIECFDWNFPKIFEVEEDN